MAVHPKKKVFGAKEYLQVDPQKLIALRGHKGFTQDELSRAVGIRRNTLYQLESGEARSVSTKTIWSLCLALGCGFSDLVTRYFYEDPAHSQSSRSYKDHRSVDLSIFNIGRKYLINGEKMILDDKFPGKGVIHFVFRQVSAGWVTCYTNIDFYVGDVSVQPL